MPSANGPSLAPSKPFSISLKSKDKPKPSLVDSVSVTSSKKRPHSALADPDSDNEDSRPGAVTVTAFDSGKAVSADIPNTKAPLVIPAEKNRDWRAEGRKKRSKNLLPKEEQAVRNGLQGSTNGGVERVEVSQEAGLKITVKNDKDGDVAMSEGGAVVPVRDKSPEHIQNADEDALAALLGAEKKSTLTIPAASEDDGFHNNGDLPMDQSAYTNEDERFRADLASRPESASLADYASIPVEEFGKAALRGMGWKEGDPIGKRRFKSSNGGAVASEVKPREVKRRPALLGIGAKEVPGGVPSDVELGAWGVGAKGKRTGGGRGGKPEAYNPVMLKNAETGEMITEEELELRRAEARGGAREKGREATGEEDWRQRRDRNLASSGRKRSQDREGERRREHGGSSSSSSHRKRSRSAERRDGHDASSSSSRRRHRSRSKERSAHRHSSYGDDRATSRRDRSGSTERRHRRSERDYDYDGRRERDRDKGGDREKTRDGNRDRDSHRDRDRDYRRR